MKLPLPNPYAEKAVVAPDWRDKPTSKGMYLCKRQGEISILLILGPDDPLALARRDSRWYGPIPSDTR